jgi:hypothetical protein
MPPLKFCPHEIAEGEAAMDGAQGMALWARISRAVEEGRLGSVARRRGLAERHPADEGAVVIVRPTLLVQEHRQVLRRPVDPAVQLLADETVKVTWGDKTMYRLQLGVEDASPARRQCSDRIQG